MSGFYVTNDLLDLQTFDKKSKYLESRGSHKTSRVLDRISVAETSFKPEISEVVDGCYAVLDGNIYNSANLELGMRECKSSTELLISLYKKYGVEMVRLLNGAFSFIIYDRQKDIIFGARDRLGEKPFFYSFNHHEGTIECSSSLKAICCDKRYLSINENAKNMYIKYGFIYDSACIFNEVSKLGAGHYFIYDLGIRSLTISKYWDNEPHFFDNYPKFDNVVDTIHFINELLENAIKLRFSEDEKIGMGISGGTDSFSIFSYLHQMGKDIPLYNVIPNDQGSFNEYPKALEHVQVVCSDKSINGIRLTDKDYEAGIADYLKYYDEPNSDFSCPVTNLLFKGMAADGISVALSGIGADDFFFGKPVYTRYFNNIEDYIVSYSDLEILCDAKKKVADFSSLLDPSNKLSMQHYDMKTYLPNLLVKEDIASTHYGIEIRNPFCDYRLVEFLNTLDERIIYGKSVIKFLLKQLILEKFKVDFFGAAKKGFSPALHRIEGLKSVRDDIFATLSRNNIQMYFPEISYAKIQEKLSQYYIGDQDRSLLNLYFYIRVMNQYYGK